MASAIYVDGRRAAEPGTLRETHEACRRQEGVARIGLYKPTGEEIEPVADAWVNDGPTARKTGVRRPGCRV